MDESYSFRTGEAGLYSARQGSGRRTRDPVRGFVAIALAAFLAGAALTYFLSRDGDSSLLAGDAIFRMRAETPEARSSDGPAESQPSPAPSAAGTASNAREAAARVEEMAEQQGGIDARVAAMEQRLARLDLQSQAAAGNAARAEGLLISFAARRAIERGAPLGYLADQLRLRFADALPNAVATVISTGESPITLDQLIAQLDGLAPVLAQIPSGEGFVSRIGREVSQLFVVRREDTPSPRAASRLERARLFLESGRTEAAIAEVRNMPGADNAAEWITDAERYARTQQALELIETTAVLEPRELRDGSGNRVEQPSPVS